MQREHFFALHRDPSIANHPLMSLQESYGILFETFSANKVPSQCLKMQIEKREMDFF